jgi:hypothetical protein
MLSKKLLHCDLMQRARVKSKLYLPGNTNNNVALPLAPVEKRSPADEQIPSAGMPRGIAAPQAVPTVRESSSTGRQSFDKSTRTRWPHITMRSNFRTGGPCC